MCEERLTACLLQKAWVTMVSTPSWTTPSLPQTPLRRVHKALFARGPQSCPRTLSQTREVGSLHHHPVRARNVVSQPTTAVSSVC